MSEEGNNANNNENEDLITAIGQLNENMAKQNSYLEKLAENSTKELSIKETPLDVNSSTKKDYREKSNVRLLDEETLKDIKIKIYEKDITFTGGNIPLAQDIYYAQKLGLKLRHIEADLNGGSLAFDGSKYRSSIGEVKFDRIRLGAKDIFQGIIRKNNNEDFFWPAVKGFGSVSLNDTVRYLHMVRCPNPRRFIFENGVYLASAGNFKFGTAADVKMGSMLLSKKNAFQMSLEGVGLVILELPVHPSELEFCKVEVGRPVRVNGQQVIYREGNVKRNVRMASTLFGSLATGAGFVEEYTGEGIVVLAPTLNVFDVIAKDLGEDALNDNLPSAVKNKFKSWFNDKNGNQSDRGYNDTYEKD